MHCPYLRNCRCLQQHVCYWCLLCFLTWVLLKMLLLQNSSVLQKQSLLTQIYLHTNLSAYFVCVHAFIWRQIYDKHNWALISFFISVLTLSSQLPNWRTVYMQLTYTFSTMVNKIVMWNLSLWKNRATTWYHCSTLIIHLISWSW